MDGTGKVSFRLSHFRTFNGWMNSSYSIFFRYVNVTDNFISKYILICLKLKNFVSMHLN